MIKPYGQPSAPYMVIAEAPGKQELARGVTFVGPTGTVFWGTGAEVGLRRELCYVTNVVQSAPLGSTGKPTVAQVKEEWDRLDTEMLNSSAEVVILVGGIAVKRVTGIHGKKKNIVDTRGYVLRPEDCLQTIRTKLLQIEPYKSNRKCPDCKVLGTPSKTCPLCEGTGWLWRIGDPRFAPRKVPVDAVLPPNCKYLIPVMHPSGIMRSVFKTIVSLKVDLGRAVRARGGLLDLIDRVEYIEEPSLAWDYSSAMDIETGYEPFDWQIDRIGIANEHGCVSLAWDQAAIDFTQDIAYDENVEKIFHNNAFDIPRLEHAGVTFRGSLFDTMYAAQLMQPDLPKGLGRASTIYMDLTPWKATSDDDPVPYNAKDAVVTRRLRDCLKRDIVATGQLRVFQNMMKAQAAIRHMHTRGLKVDVDHLGTWRESLVRDQMRAVAAWPRDDVSVGSTKQLAMYLYGDLHLPVQEGDGGNTSTDAASITALLMGLDNGLYTKLTDAEQAEARVALTSLRDLRRLNTDIKTYAKLEAGPDGRIHPDYLPMDKDELDAADKTKKGQGAGTGRIQPRRPNLSNQHLLARYNFIPYEPDQCFAYLDWIGGEQHLDFALSGDQLLEKAVLGGLKQYLMDRTGLDGTRSKNLYYGTRNGMGVNKMLRTARHHGYTNITQNDIREEQEMLAKIFPDWWEYRETRVRFGLEFEYLQTKMGRRRPFYHPRSRRTAMLGYDSQSCLADILWEDIPLVDAVDGCEIATTVYDAFLICGPQDQIRGACEAVAEIMTRERPLIRKGFRIPVDIKVGQAGESWGAMEARYERGEAEAWTVGCSGA